MPKKGSLYIEQPKLGRKHPMRKERFDSEPYGNRSSGEDSQVIEGLVQKELLHFITSVPQLISILFMAAIPGTASIGKRYFTTAKSYPGPQAGRSGRIRK
jgi:hypothetical protein